MKRVLSIICIIALVFCLPGCSDFAGGTSGSAQGVYTKVPENSFSEYNYGFYDSKESIFDNADDYYYGVVLTVDGNDYSGLSVKADSNACNAFIDYLNGIDTEYTYSRYYKLDEALNNYDSIEGKKATAHENLLEEITVDGLMERVKANNKAYKEAEKQNYVQDFYEEFSDEDLEMYCSMVIATVNFYIEMDKVEDMDELRCILGDLKIFSKPIISNAYVSDDNCLIINPDMVETLSIKMAGEGQNLLLSTVAHETNHMLQKGCIHNNAIVYNIANSYKFENMDIHPLFNSWFYEGAAEKLMLNFTGYVPLVYEYYINYINSLSLSVVLNERNSVFQVEETTLHNSLDYLFDTFGCSNEKEEKELLNMMFSLEIIETDDPEFVSAVDPDMSDDELVAIKRTLKGEICKTMAKYFYESLTLFLCENQVPLNDVFYYITVFENDVNSHIDFSNADKLAAAKDFVSDYTEIQDEFFKLLADATGISEDRVEEMFNAYGLVTADGTKNFSYTGVPTEKQKLFSYVLNFSYDSSFKNIRSYN